MPHLPRGFKKLIGKSQKVRGDSDDRDRPFLTLGALSCRGVALTLVTVDHYWTARAQPTHIRPRQRTNQMQQTITTTASPNTNAHRKALPAPPGNDQDRGNNFAGSLRPRIDLIAKLRARNSRPAAKLERLDEEDEYIDQTKQEIRCIKIQDIGAARNALRMAQQAFEAGTGTLSQLQLQGDRLKNAENNLDQAAFANKDGARKLKALETSKLYDQHSEPFCRSQAREAI
ncbi:hypothetical protein HBI26_005080 [Parastagonospora nodorum]|nr:hypothetical protein HBH54_016010 [Parastagonospora nodorum]KAH4006908.1 hypothetical protein HBI10_015890 [Parastagonospora nodorum]KAH4332334.1 hypothetical protein HBI00_057150 [Parastagonospora nodorum]KAH4641919.1 hypothetical protein HBH55_015320 [Parastagonospora nodorum]KAH5441041.1 hypothetical protein HBI47_040160 [Parastagonospora nodorum]